MRTLPHLSDAQLLSIFHSYQRGGVAPDTASAARYHDAVKALRQRGYVVDDPHATQENAAILETDEFESFQDDDYADRE